MKKNLLTKVSSMRAFLKPALLTILTLFAVSCNREDHGEKIKEAHAYLNATSGNRVRGSVTFTAVEGGVKIIADIDNLTPGEHGFHIHEHGNCSASDASSAGGHFNPTNKQHAGPDAANRHEGDLGNLIADENGHAHYERIDKVISLNGPNSIIGKSVIVHEKADDYKTQPSGDSGDRVACGVIVR